MRFTLGRRFEGVEEVEGKRLVGREFKLNAG
jgi:hypothetical protein